MNNYNMNFMKRGVSIIVAFTMCLTVMAQQELNRTIPTNESVEKVGVDFISGEIVINYSSESLEHYEFTINGSEFGDTIYQGSSVNDIHSSNGEVFTATGSQLSVSHADGTAYYGTNNGVTFNGSSISTSIPVNTITSDGSLAYIVDVFGGDHSIIKLDGSTSPIYTSNITNSAVNSIIEIEYFNFGGNYIAIIYSNGTTNQLGFYNLDSETFSTTNIYNDFGEPTSIKYSNGSIFFSTGHKIYEITDISDMQNMGTSIEYVLENSSATINDFDFYNGTLVTVAATDGVYTENEGSLNVEVEKETFDNVRLYPNPNKGEFAISNLKEGSSIIFYNAYGEAVYSAKNLNKTSFKVNVELPSGFYTVSVANGEGEVNKKVVIK